MEGPTPSSAVFYGALSVHLGTFLLLRVSPILELSVGLSAAVVALGLASAVFASLVGRVQTDVKGALAFASLTQVGLITAEIGLGLRYIPLIHIIGHACLRTLQLLRAPSLLRDYRTLENAVGEPLHRHRNRHRTHTDSDSERPAAGDLSASASNSASNSDSASLGLGLVLYRVGFERGQLDAAIDRFVVRPFVRLFQGLDWAERCWTDVLSGRASRESDRVEAVSAASPAPGEEA
jgi:NAD(P)H-quinone oxidoreductase subunit 5